MVSLFTIQIRFIFHFYACEQFVNCVSNEPLVNQTMWVYVKLKIAKLEVDIELVQ